MNSIALIGMMGSGKSTLGKMLSEKTGMLFYCSDEYIENENKMSIPEIFKKEGESYFRRLEHEAIKELSIKKNIILSTGGGVVLNPENIACLKKNHFTIIYLNRSMDHIMKDITIENRPLLDKGADQIYEIYNQREGLYKKHCDMMINNDSNLNEAVDKIINILSIGVKDILFGGEKLLICIPLVSKETDSLINDAKKALKVQPDLIEWRVDYFNEIEKEEIILNLKLLREVIGSTPVIFTFRSQSEGGLSKLSEEERIKIITTVIASRLIDLVDIEMSSGKPFIETIKEEARKHDVKMILSYHNFDMTPSQSFMIEKFKEAEALGADVAKIAVMPVKNEDVLQLMVSTLQASKVLNIPMIAMSMGQKGMITRIAGKLFGSDLTFACMDDASAPGQIKVENLRQVLSFMTGESEEEKESD
ncbi:MAG: type I 3-dehydroquinate dehydratase [Tissierellales bacterium]|nr:type I 3-dehydroquinate dehydratase [Tissierellales bacterium]MBN2827223.1 type I 3-dehydroquinate dehydratase [Tissierellales bacterium]